MNEAERVSENDRLLVIRTQVRLRSAQELQDLVLTHLLEVYGLRSGDKIDDDGRILRAAPPSDSLPLSAA